MWQMGLTPGKPRRRARPWVIDSGGSFSLRFPPAILAACGWGEGSVVQYYYDAEARRLRVVSAEEGHVLHPVGKATTCTLYITQAIKDMGLDRTADVSEFSMSEGVLEVTLAPGLQPLGRRKCRTKKEPPKTGGKP